MTDLYIQFIAVVYTNLHLPYATPQTVQLDFSVAAMPVYLALELNNFRRK